APFAAKGVNDSFEGPLPGLLSGVVKNAPNYSSGGSAMTVCIAAVCDGGKSVVVAADRMFTAPAPMSMEFETSERKIESLGTGCVALSSGNSAYASEIIAGTLTGLAGAQQPVMSLVAERIKEAYVAVRMSKVREQIVVPHMGPDFLRVEATGRTLPEYLQP